MSQSITQIRCPNCSNPIQAEISQLVDVHQDPGAKARLLSGSLNVANCGVCGYHGQVATPLVYHDHEKELLLTFVPVEIGMPQDEQERIIGRLITQATQGLEAEQRKGYLFQPQAVLTMQGLIERILEGDGITQEEIDAQRAKLRLFEEMLRTPEDELKKFAEEHDAELDAIFFQLATLSLQATQDENAQQAANQRIESLLPHTTFGKDLVQKETEFRAAAESIQQAGDSITHESLLQIFIDAPNAERVNALVQLTRPALDYTFFQRLTEKIDTADAEAKENLENLRTQILDLTQEIDRLQEARAQEAASLLKVLVEAEDLDAAILEALPLVDELFLSILQANIKAAQERSDQNAESKLTEIDLRLRETIRESLPAGLQLAQRVLEIEDHAEIEAILEVSAHEIDQDMLGALMATAQRLETSGNVEGAEIIREIYRIAIRVSMKAKVNTEEN